jgi:signal transduction histidine kinase
VRATRPNGARMRSCSVDRTMSQSAITPSSAEKIDAHPEQSRGPAADGMTTEPEVSVYRLGRVSDEMASTEDHEAAHRIGDSQLDNALAVAALGTFDWSPDTNGMVLSGRSRAILGFPSGATHSADEVFARIHDDDRSRVLERLAQSRGELARLELEYRIRLPDESVRYVKSVSNADEADGERRIVGVLEDVTERRVAEQQLRELNETLEQRVQDRTAELLSTQASLRQSQKMEAIGELTGGMAHDFNNLLTGVSGALEMMRVRLSQGRIEDVLRFVAAAQDAAKRAAALTHRLLAFSRRQTLSPQLSDINRLTLDMERLVRSSIGPQIELEIFATPGVWLALVDRNQVENALLNLCINARDAMPNGGRLTVETNNRWFDERAGREQELVPGHYVSLSVSDTGTGMTRDVVARAFDPFFTTKPVGDGTGLGLSMIYGFARQSGGHVRIYSEVGKGTTVCIYLPRAFGDGEVIDDMPAIVEGSRAHEGEAVLIVDDEPSVRMLVTEVLRDLGYAAIEAADGVAGLKLLQSGARIDLLVTDVGLPGSMNGRQLADAGRAIRPDLRVLFITGYPEHAVVNHGHLAAGMQILTKPFAVQALVIKMKDMIEG